MPLKKLIEYKEEIVVPVYNATLYMIFTSSVYRTIKKFHVEAPTDYKDADGAVVYDSHPTIIFHISPTLNTLVHEVSHASEIILELRGVEPKGEQRAYLEGFIAEKIDEVNERAKKYFTKHKL